MFRQEKSLLVILSTVYAIIGCSIYNPSMQSLSMMGWFGLAQLIFCVISWMKRGNQLLSPYIIFLICLYIFSFGQSFLWAFGLDSERTLVGFHNITIPEIFIAQVQTIIMLAFFHIGASYCLQRQGGRYYTVDSTSSYCTYRLKRIGWLLFFISIVPYVSETINDMLASITRGYLAAYEGKDKVGLDNLFGFIADYFIPSVICLFIVYKDNKLVRTFFISLFILNIVAILLTGGRSNAVILLAILLLLYNYLVTRFTRRWLLIGVIGSYMLLQVLAFVASVRVEGMASASKDGVQIENNAAVDAIAEMGGTMYCLIQTTKLIPERYTYKYGKSYAYAFTTIIPNLGFWDIHPAKKESNLGDWLTEELGLGYGTGFSMCAEAYANFGYLGFIVFFFWGWFIASVFGKIEISLQTRDYALMAFLLILFWYFLKLPRNNFINLVRPIFFVAGPIYLYCTRFNRRLK